MIRFFTKLIKIMYNTWNRFWKKLGNCPGPEHFKSPCAAVPRHCSLHFLTRGRRSIGKNLYYFYMSDHINAVYSNMYLVVTVCASKSVPEGPDKSPKYWRDAEPMIKTRFFQKISITLEFTLSPMTWKPSLPRRIAGVSVRQESLRRPSVIDQRRKYSPEGTRVIPRGRHVS